MSLYYKMKEQEGYMIHRDINCEYVKQLQKYLNGLTDDMPEVFSLLAEILKEEAFEICLQKETGEYLIPYMMNDAVEYYLILKNARMTGQFLADQKVISANLARESSHDHDNSGITGRYVLVVRQENGNICTVLFYGIEERYQCYQYHGIGHFWVKGQEHWRRLVYIVGTIFDKFQYLGPEFCNDKEKELLKLMGFAPFRHWTPIHESLDDYYIDTRDGLQAMEDLAVEAQDIRYLKMLRLYGWFKCGWTKKLLSRMLLEPSRLKLYEKLVCRIEDASKEYPERDYGYQKNLEIQQMRDRISEGLIKLGFEGEYPEFKSKGALEEDSVCVFAAEEHPYVNSDMEYENFKFRIQLMIRENNSVRICESSNELKNAKNDYF